MDRSPWTLYRLRRDRLFAIEQRGARGEPIIEEGPGNRFLRALPPPLSERLSGDLERMPLERGTVLFHAGASTGNLYFPDRGLVSLVKTMSDGRTAEVGFVGTEGLVGVAALVGMERAAFETIVQLDGAGHMVKADLLRAEMQQSASLKELVLRYLYYSVHQLAQTAACNRLHTLRQRCCRWLLTAEDNAGAPSFTLTHEFLALMMGVNRPSLSLAIAGLKRRGLVEYVRASISVLDRRELEKGTCECYWALRQECDRVYAA
jgi:CRP-like cAMP-binding protein